MKTIKDALAAIAKAGRYEAGIKLFKEIEGLSEQSRKQAALECADAARASYAKAADITVQVLRNRENEEARQVVKEVLKFLSSRTQRI